MTIRYSDCHFAEVMISYYVPYPKGLKSEEYRCSFCGEKCKLVPLPFTVREDVELTLRRWKDGDCTLDEMFTRLNKEYRRTWYEVFELAEKQLQKEGEPMYKYEDNADPLLGKWIKK